MKYLFQNSCINCMRFYLIIPIFIFVNAFAQKGYLENKDIPEKPNPARLVNDIAGMFDNNDKALLEQKLRKYNIETSTQIAVVTVPSVKPYAIEDYAIRLFRKWEIGQAKKNNGILLLIANNDREVDIELGYGIERQITDADCRSIIKNIIVPNFKKSNYINGVNEAVDAIQGILTGAYTAEDINGNELSLIQIIILILIIIFILYLFSKMNKNRYITYHDDDYERGVRRGGGWLFPPNAGGGGYFDNNRGGGGGFDFGGFGGGSAGGGGASGSW